MKMRKSDLGICEKCKHMKHLVNPGDISAYKFVMSCGSMTIERVNGTKRTTVQGDCYVCERPEGFQQVTRNFNSDCVLISCNLCEEKEK